MKPLCLFFCLLIGVPSHVWAAFQDATPVLKAGSRSVDVNDGGRLLKGVWLADPTVPLDIYQARRASAPKSVVFISDRGTLSFELGPGESRDFAIGLDEGGACRTRITVLPAAVRVDGGDASQPVEIPIRIVQGKLHLHGRINQSEELDLIFDTGADTSVLYPSGVRKGARVGADGTSTNSGTGGTSTVELGRSNRLEVGALRWDDEPILIMPQQADAADGIVGYPVFEGKVVELDYDRMVMTVMDSLPARAAEFSRVDLKMAGSLTAVDATLASGGQHSSGPVILDTAGTAALLVNHAFAKAHPLLGGLQVIGESVSRGVGPGTVRNEVAVLPELVVAGFSVRQVPIDIATSAEKGAEQPVGKLCMEVLSRFNTILDYRNNHAYFKPNGRFAEPFAERGAKFGGAAIVAIVGGVVAAAAALAWVALRTSLTRRSPGRQAR